MAVDLYTIAWNERRILPFFFDHYEPWVDRFVVFDDGSDDGTAEALARHPKVDLRPFPPKGDSFVQTVRQLWQQVWKESRGRADWVVVTNVDEFFHHPEGMGRYLRRCSDEGVTIIHPRGYEMVGERFPANGVRLVEELPYGVPMFGQDKRQAFNPNAIEEINFAPGRHSCNPTGSVVEPRTVETVLLHYKYIDPHAYTIPRQKVLGARLLPGDVRQGFGMQYRLTPDDILNSFEWLKMHASLVARQTV
jgi:glycosyltransferase involved in cell wall biosynthesis